MCALGLILKGLVKSLKRLKGVPLSGTLGWDCPSVSDTRLLPPPCGHHGGYTPHPKIPVGACEDKSKAVSIVDHLHCEGHGHMVLTIPTTARMSTGQFFIRVPLTGTWCIRDWRRIFNALIWIELTGYCLPGELNRWTLEPNIFKLWGKEEPSKFRYCTWILKIRGKNRLLGICIQ